MFVDNMSSVFRSFTYYIHAGTKKKKKFHQRNLRLLSLVLIRVYEFRLARGVLLSECVRAHDVGGDGVA